MSSPDVFEILKAWKQNELGIFVFWASSVNRSVSVSFSFEGRIEDVDEELISVIGEPSERVKGTLKQQASISLVGSTAKVAGPERARFEFPSGAVLEVFLS